MSRGKKRSGSGWEEWKSIRVGQGTGKTSVGISSKRTEKVENGWKKVGKPAFGCPQHPRAG